LLLGHALCLYLQVHQLGQASFKAIIGAYKRQPQARPDTFKTGAPPFFSTKPGWLALAQL
jgi:hypothetical protein